MLSAGAGRISGFGLELEGSVRDPELGIALGWLFFHFDAIDPGQRRPFAAPLDHPVHGVRLPFEHSLDAAVGTIPDTSPEAEPTGTSGALSAKEDPLHLPRHEHLDPFQRKRKRVNSGTAGSSRSSARTA